MRKILSISLALILVFSGLVPIYAETSATEKYEKAGNILKDLKLLSGDENGNLMLGNNLKRQDMVIMISRLYKQENVAKDFTGPNKFKDLTAKQKNYIPFISWANSKGLISGFPDGTFGFGLDITVQEYQSVLLRALGYNEDWKMVPEISNRYGIMENLSLTPSSKLTRGQMAVMTVNALKQEKNGRDITLAEELGVTLPVDFTVESTLKVENNSLIFTGQAKGTDNLWIYIKPASSNTTAEDRLSPVPTDAEGNFSYRVDNLKVGNYQYRFQSGTEYTTFQTVSIEVLPFDLVSVKADNLKEITLTYTQPVDKSTASILNNYITTAGSIKDIRFEEKDTKVILTINGNMTQRMKYKISALKTKSTLGEEILLKDHEFEALDTQSPTIVSVKQLGTKGLRVYLSEPVKSAIPTNFKIDGKNFSGNTKLENNIVTLSYFSSAYALTVGNHTLTISGLQDFAGNKALNESISFDVIKDTTPPSITGATATLEEVIIEFDEDIDPTQNTTRNFYWKQNSSKRYPNKVTIEGNKAKLEFINNRLSTTKYTIYVENVVDYSNNKMKSGEIDVIPTIDTTSPEVINYVVSEDGKTITVYYSKYVIGNVRNNYSILDKDNKQVSIRDIQGSGKEYKINLFAPLPAGVNTLTIKDIQDSTPLKNPLVPFTTTIDMKDVEKPRVVNHTGYANHIIIHFSKQMDMTTISNPNNYYMTFNGNQHRLPSNTLFTSSNDGKSVTILLPEYYDGKQVMIGLAGNLTALDIVGLKDVSGNDTDPLMVKITFDGTLSGKAKAVNYYNDKPGRQGVLTDSNTIKVRFSIPIVQASINDFSIREKTIYDVIADGTDEVTIYLHDSNITYLPTGALSIVANNNMRTSIDTGVESGTILLFDEITPKVKDNANYLTVSGNQIELPFTEALEEEGATLYRRDLEIVRLADNKILSKDDYTTSLKSSDKSILLITITKRDITSSYSIRLTGEAGSGTLSYIRDKDGNLALPSDVYFTSKDISK